MVHLLEQGQPASDHTSKEDWFSRPQKLSMPIASQLRVNLKSSSLSMLEFWLACCHEGLAQVTTAAMSSWVQPPWHVQGTALHGTVPINWLFHPSALSRAELCDTDVPVSAGHSSSLNLIISIGCESVLTAVHGKKRFLWPRLRGDWSMGMNLFRNHLAKW